MPEVKCVEPANLAEGDGYVVAADANTDLLFPHVDSCLAMALVLNDDRIIGGHVGIQWDGNSDIEPAGNAVRIMNQMLQGVGTATIQKVIFLGDPAWNRHFIGEEDWLPNDPYRPALPDVKALLPRTMRNIRIFVKGAVDGGVDVRLSRAPALKIKISRTKLPRLELHSCLIAAIQGEDSTDFEDATNAVGQTCSKCAKVHGDRPATFLGYWHVCQSCNKVFCNICGKWTLSREKYFERARLCPCGGKTQLVA